jgi:hypothetical protein
MLLESPASFGLQPMMINTKNPNGGPHPGGPVPTGNKAPPGAVYSGLLECPCTDRKKKVVTNHNTQELGACAVQVAGAPACFAAVAALGLTPITSNSTVGSGAAPPGCSVVATQNGYEATFNTRSASTVQCGPPAAAAAAGGGGAGVAAGGPRAAFAGSAGPILPVRSLGSDSAIGVEVDLDLNEGSNCTAATSDLSGEWVFQKSASFPGTASYQATFAAVAAQPVTMTSPFPFASSVPDSSSPICPPFVPY